MTATPDIRGPGYPFAIDPQTGGFGWSQGRQKLTDNLRLIIGTRLGERPMNRNFGTPVHDLVHEPNDASLSRLITRQVREALIQLEPRIVITDMQVQQQAGELMLELRYIPADRPQPETIYLPLG